MERHSVFTAVAIANALAGRNVVRAVHQIMKHVISVLWDIVPPLLGHDRKTSRIICPKRKWITDIQRVMCAHGCEHGREHERQCRFAALIWLVARETGRGNYSCREHTHYESHYDPPPTLPVELNLFKTRFGARHACFKMMVVCAIYWNRDVAVSSLSHLVGLKSHNRHPFSSVPGHDICRQVDRRQASPEDLSLRFVV